MNLKQTTITGQRLVFRRGHDHYVGPDVILRECSVAIDCRDAELTFARVTLENCQISITKSLHDQDFFSTRFENCSFHGYLHGLRFGRFTTGYEDDDGIETFGAINNSSFRRAILHLTDFLNVDMSTVQLPSWPCFTLFSPSSRSDLLNYAWPGRLQILVRMLVGSPEFTSAVVCHAPDVLEDFDVDEASLRRSLAEAGGFAM